MFYSNNHAYTKEHKTIINKYKSCILNIFQKIMNKSTHNHISIYPDISYQYIDMQNDQSMTALLLPSSHKKGELRHTII